MVARLVHSRAVGHDPAPGLGGLLAPAEEHGLALLICLVVLALCTLLGLSLAVNATTAMRTGDNYEGLQQARYAALGGLRHARELFRGLNLSDQLAGPDGSYSSDLSYLTSARSHRFRNPINLSLAAVLDIDNPAMHLAGLPDDGLLNSGYYGALPGVALIPLEGIPSLDLSSPGVHADSRYFVRVADNNGESSERAGDPSDNPFVDGDGIVLVRSLGIARTLREFAGSEMRNNSLCVYEGRFKRRRTWDLPAPLVILGVDILPSAAEIFEGDSLHIWGGAANAGIATIDWDSSDGIAPLDRLRAALRAEQEDNVEGAGLTPSLQDVTASVRADSERALLLESGFLHRFLYQSLPTFADNSWYGTQEWSTSSCPDLGHYDPGLPAAAPGQQPRVTCVYGDLSLSGDISGGGILVVSGTLRASGRFLFSGLLLVLGTGELDLRGPGSQLRGGVFLASLPDPGGAGPAGFPCLTVGSDAQISWDGRAVDMAVSLMPMIQLGFREITNVLDPD